MSLPELFAPEVTPVRRSRWKMSPARWLLVAVVAFFAVSFALSWLRAIEFQTSTWDEGVYQQAIWMTAHGRPFYETPDVETGGYGSLLQVHTVFLFYVLVPLYAAFPFQTTLFAVQSAVVAVAAISLFLLARSLTGRPELGLVAGVGYLAWTPVLSSTLYDFHPEAFLPVEMFSLVLLWQLRRYRWGFFVAGLSFSTMELAPVLTCFVGLFALLLVGFAPPAPQGSLERSRGALLRTLGRIRAWLGDPRVRASLGLIVLSAAVYEVLVYLRVDYLTSTLGTYPLSAPATGYVIGSTPAGLQLSFANVGIGLIPKLTYWLVLLALLGFVPLFAPRALVLSVPWFAFTLLSSNLNYVTLGFQYGFIAACSLLIAFAYGLPRARWVAASVVSLLARGRRFSGRVTPEIPAGRRPRVTVVVALVLLLVVNLGLTPLDPVMDNHGLGSAYRISFAPNPGNDQVDQLASEIPAGATVISSDNLFPLVANDENAYSFSWVNDPGLALPFSPAELPRFVLVAEDSSAAVTPWIAGMLYNSSDYGVRGVVWSSGPGVVLLFEAGYHGVPTEFGVPSPTLGVFYGSSVVAPDAGVVATAPNANFASVVESRPGTLGMVWNTPALNVNSGTETISLSLRVAPLPGEPAPSAGAPVLSVDGTAFGESGIPNATLTFGSLSAPGWHTLEYIVPLSEPLIELAVDGVLLDPSVQVTLNFVSIGPAGPSPAGPGA